jgi:hypothetical protein
MRETGTGQQVAQLHDGYMIDDDDDDSRQLQSVRMIGIKN